jgi:hypothetical protein
MDKKQDIFFSEKGEGSSIAGEFLEHDGEITDQFMTINKGTYDLTDGGFESRGFYQGNKYFIEQQGMLKTYVDVANNWIYSAQTGNALGYIIGNDVWDAHGMFKGRLPAASDDKRFMIANKMLGEI